MFLTLEVAILLTCHLQSMNVNVVFNEMSFVVCVLFWVDFADLVANAKLLVRKIPSKQRWYHIPRLLKREMWKCKEQHRRKKLHEIPQKTYYRQCECNVRKRGVNFTEMFCFLIDWLIKLGFNVTFSNKIEIHHSHKIIQHVFRYTWSNTIVLLVHKNRHKFFYALILHYWVSDLDSCVAF